MSVKGLILDKYELQLRVSTLEGQLLEAHRIIGELEGRRRFQAQVLEAMQSRYVQTQSDPQNHPAT